MKLFAAPRTISVAAAIALEEAGVDYDLHMLDFASGAQRDDAYLAINPKGRVPALALDDGTILVSFEARGRIGRLDPESATVTELPVPDMFRELQNNSGLEALATDRQNRVLAIPERSGKLDRPFPVYRRDGDSWSVPYAVRRDGGPFLVAGADTGPDGRLYVLERDFAKWRGFATRVRSVAYYNGVLTDERLILQTPLGRHDNLEGLAVWRGCGKARADAVVLQNLGFFRGSVGGARRVGQLARQGAAHAGELDRQVAWHRNPVSAHRWRRAD